MMSNRKKQRMRQKIKRTDFLLAWAVKCSILLAGIFLYIVFAEWTGLSLPCPFHWLTGLQCPGCGATRMCAAVLHGQWDSAWQANPMLLGSLPVLLLLSGTEEYCCYRQCPEPRWLNIAACFLVAAFLLFGIGRNL